MREEVRKQYFEEFRNPPVQRSLPGMSREDRRRILEDYNIVPGTKVILGFIFYNLGGERNIILVVTLNSG